MAGKPATRAPTARDDRMRAAMAALLAEGSTRKAAKATGIPYRTIGVWAESDEGKALIEELRTAGNEAHADVFAEIKATYIEILKEQQEQYLAALKAKEIPARDLAIHMGIVSDKLARMGPPAANDAGEIVVQVFGGTLGGGGTPAQGVAVQVTAKGGKA